MDSLHEFLAVSDACMALATGLAEVLAEREGVDFDPAVIVDVASVELFSVCQDVALIFAPITEQEEAAATLRALVDQTRRGGQAEC